MKLSAQQIADVRDTLGASPIPDEHPAMGQLQQAFGDHTFYLHEQGLSAFFGPEEAEMPDDQPKLMMLATWSDGERTQLEGIQPVPTGHVLPDGEEGGAEESA